MKTDTSKATILVIAMGFLAISLAFAIHWAAIVSLIVGVSGALSTYLSFKIEWIWMKLAKVLGYIIPNILLCLVFYLILYPISLMSKLSNKDPLMLLNKYDSYFIDVNNKPDKTSFEKTW
jgi:fluoride ion exporter CrcB/FEX